MPQNLMGTTSECTLSPRGERLLMSWQDRLESRRAEVQYGRAELIQILVGDFAHDLFAVLLHGDEVPHIVPVAVVLLLRLLDSQSLALEVVLDDDCALVPLQLDVRIGRAKPVGPDPAKLL